MPYRHAHYFVLACIAVIAVGFWPSYFAVWGEVPWQFHAHGVAASLWVLMVLAQSWTPHHGQLALHRAVGKSSLLLFPFLIGGLAAIIDVTAKGYVAGDGISRQMFGGIFLSGLVVAMAAYVTLYFRALKYRRKAWIHSGYMLGTPIILFESPFSRIMIAVLPTFAINGPEDMGNIVRSILWADALAVAFCLLVWWRHRERARPFLVTAGFVAAQMAAMGLMVETPWLFGLLRWLGSVPSVTIVMTGFAIGALTSWAGWQAGKRPVRSVTPLQAAA